MIKVKLFKQNQGSGTPFEEFAELELAARPMKDDFMKVNDVVYTVSYVIIHNSYLYATVEVHKSKPNHPLDVFLDLL